MGPMTDWPPSRNVSDPTCDEPRPPATRGCHPPRGLGQGRGGPHGGEPVDGAHQVGELEFVEDADHARFDVGGQRLGVVPVGDDQRGPLEHAVTLGGHAGVVGQGVVDAAGDAPAHPLSSQVGHRGTHRGLEP